MSRHPKTENGGGELRLQFAAYGVNDNLKMQIYGN